MDAYLNIYLLLFILPAIPCLLVRLPRLTDTDRRVYQKAAILVFFFLLFLLSGLRAHSVGNDTNNYDVVFRRFANHNLSYALSYKEPAFALLCKAVYALTRSYQFLLVVIALISLLPVAYFYRENVEYPMTTIALFMFFSVFYMYFSGMRQIIAIGLGIVAYYFTKEKKLIPFFLVVLAAYFFHRSSIALLIMYPVYWFRLMKRSVIFVVLIMGLIYVFNQPIFSLLHGLIQDYEGLGDSSTGAYTMLILLVLFCVFSFVITDEDKLDQDTIGLRNFLLVTTAIQMFVPLNFLVMRMGYYYMIFLPIALPRIMVNASPRWRSVSMLANLVLFSFFAFRFIVYAPSQNILHIFPYHFFWEMV